MNRIPKPFITGIIEAACNAVLSGNGAPLTAPADDSLAVPVC